MTADELARLFGAMTERPWRVDDDTPCAYSGDTEVMVAGDESNNYDGDMPTIVALANHADAFLELVRVTEGVTAWPSHYQLPESFIARLREALAKVHAVSKEGE